MPKTITCQILGGPFDKRFADISFPDGTTLEDVISINDKQYAIVDGPAARAIFEMDADPEYLAIVLKHIPNMNDKERGHER